MECSKIATFPRGSPLWIPGRQHALNACVRACPACLLMCARARSHVICINQVFFFFVTQKDERMTLKVLPAKNRTFATYYCCYLLPAKKKQDFCYFQLKQLDRCFSFPRGIYSMIKIIEYAWGKQANVNSLTTRRVSSIIPEASAINKGLILTFGSRRSMGQK